MHLSELKALHISKVLEQADELEIENTGRMRKQELMFAIIKKRARGGEQVFADGVLRCCLMVLAFYVRRTQATPRAPTIFIFPPAKFVGLTCTQAT